MLLHASHRPAVLFLDEPTTGLDPESRTSAVAAGRSSLAADGTTAPLTTQYLEEADALADRVVIIDRVRVSGESLARTSSGSVSASAAVALEFADEHDTQPAPQRRRETEFPAARRDRPRIVRLASEAVDFSRGRCRPRALPGPDDPVAVRIREPSLDDVFLALTSSAARASQPGDAA